MVNQGDSRGRRGQQWIAIRVDGSRFSVLEVVAESGAPARVGDELVQVDGQPTDAMPFATLIATMTASQPARRSVVVNRDGARVALDVELVAV